MKAMVDLFSTDYGLFSIGVIAFTLRMGVWFYRFFTRKMDQSHVIFQPIRKPSGSHFPLVNGLHSLAAPDIYRAGRARFQDWDS